MHVAVKAVAVTIAAVGALALQGTAAHATTPETVKATRHYNSHTGPSKAWQKASTSERRAAQRQYLAIVGNWNNGCKRDMRHAYQGRVSSPWFVQPYLPVTVWDEAPHTPAVLFAGYTEGIC